MRWSRLALTLVLAYALSGCDAKTSPGGGGDPLADTPHAAGKPLLSARLIPAADNPDGAMSIAVAIPANHHGYLDSGRDGFLVPLSFTFPDLEDKGVPLEIVATPVGNWDEKAGATVMRGKGEFRLGLAMSREIASRDLAVPAKVRYQLCNDITYICYPPAVVSVLPAGVSASAVVPSR